jgi:hypothetical protein
LTQATERYPVAPILFAEAAIAALSSIGKVEAITQEQGVIDGAIRWHPFDWRCETRVTIMVVPHGESTEARFIVRDGSRHDRTRKGLERLVEAITEQLAI